MEYTEEELDLNQKFYEDFLAEEGNTYKISDEDLDIMCRDKTDCMCIESKKICNDYINTNNVTESLLKVYVELEIETWGDCHDGNIIFIYDDIKIIGEYVDKDYPAKIKEINKII